MDSLSKDAINCILSWLHVARDKVAFSSMNRRIRSISMCSPTWGTLILDPSTPVIKVEALLDFCRLLKGVVLRHIFIARVVGSLNSTLNAIFNFAGETLLSLVLHEEESMSFLSVTPTIIAIKEQSPLRFLQIRCKDQRQQGDYMRATNYVLTHALIEKCPHLEYLVLHNTSFEPGFNLPSLKGLLVNGLNVVRQLQVPTSCRIWYEGSKWGGGGGGRVFGGFGSVAPGPEFGNTVVVPQSPSDLLALPEEIDVNLNVIHSADDLATLHRLIISSRNKAGGVNSGAGESIRNLKSRFPSLDLDLLSGFSFGPQVLRFEPLNAFGRNLEGSCLGMDGWTGSTFFLLLLTQLFHHSGT